MTIAVIVGGTRSGKSARAERLARASGRPVVYLATADAADRSLAARIAAHVARRPREWQTAEAGADLAAAVERALGTTRSASGDAHRPASGGAASDDPGAAAGGSERRPDAARVCLLLDGLGPWIATLLHRAGAFDDPSDGRLGRVRAEVDGQVARVAAALRVHADAGGAAIVVAEQAGEGVVPPDRASRAWLDLLGESTQRLAAVAARVELVVAGRSIPLGDGGGRELWQSGGPGDPRIDRGPGGGDGALAALRTHGDTAVRPGDADHAVNVRAEGPPAWLREALQRAFDRDVTRYPAERTACEALAALHGRTPDEVVPTNGAAQALWLLPAALRPRLAAVVHPGFTESEAALRAHGVEVVRVLRDPARGFALDPGAVPEAADLVIVGNPASPSGTLDPAAALLALRRPGRIVVVDEAFIDLVPGEPGSLARELLEDTIVVRSLTKSLAIPGLRAGYALAAPALAERLRAVRPPWSVNALALAALSAVAGRPEVLAAAAERTQRERDDLQRRLTAIDGLRTWPSAVNYCLLEVADGAGVAAALRERRIAVREAASFPGLDARHLRLTARTPEQNARLCAALAEAIGGGGGAARAAAGRDPARAQAGGEAAGAAAADGPAEAAR